MEFDPGFPLPTPRQREVIDKYFGLQLEFMTMENFFDDPVKEKGRKYAIHTITKYSKDEEFDAFVPYLAMNYYDRFVSRCPLPGFGGENRQHIGVFAICCLIIAAKMRLNSFSASEFLTRQGMSIPPKYILQGELSLLNGLQWRMRSITAFDFVDYYYYPRFKELGGFGRRGINEIIIQSQGVTYFNRYKPSEIAFFSLLAASGLAYPRLFVHEGEEWSECASQLVDMCNQMNIWIERAKSKRVTSPSTETAGYQPFERRPGKEPASTSRTVPPAAESTPKNLFNFDIKWIINETEDLTLELFEPKLQEPQPQPTPPVTQPQPTPSETLLQPTSPEIRPHLTPLEIEQAHQGTPVISPASTTLQGQNERDTTDSLGICCQPLNCNCNGNTLSNAFDGCCNMVPNCCNIL